MKETIALIDDDRNILTSISIALEKEGFKVQTYLDGESALIGLSRTPPDLAVIDIKMPKMDGEELLKKLRKKTSLPVIFLTSKDDEIDELLGLKSGCSNGVGGSCCIQCKEINMFGHSGLLGEQVPLAVGACFAKKQLTLTIFGDAAIEEDYVAPALGWAVTNNLPIVFICEDNDLSVLTKTEDRRSWRAVDLANSLNMYAVDITDDPWLIAYHVKKIRESGEPGFINIRTVRGIWHAGTGVDNDLEWNRYELVEKELSVMGLSKEMTEININNKEKVKSTNNI